jgi:putative restriction endonuclease
MTGYNAKKCRLTGVSEIKLLIASHIKPWGKCQTSFERLDGNNGLLLSPHVDRLFDRGYISFSEDGSLLVSKQIQNDILISWGIDPNLNVGMFLPEQETYLQFHRREVFKK